MEPEAASFRTGTRGRRLRRARPARSTTYAALQGTLGEGRDAPARRAAARATRSASSRTRSGISPSLRYDEDQRDNTINAQAPAGADSVRARLAQAESLVQPRAAARSRSTTVRAGWTRVRTLRRLPLRDRGSLPPAGARARREGRAPDVAVEPLLPRRRTTPTRRCRPPTSSIPTITLSTGDEVTLTYGQYRAILATNRNQADRAAAFRALHEHLPGQRSTPTRRSTTACCQRDWFHARARGYTSTLEPRCTATTSRPSVVENLIATTQGRRRAAAPLSPPAQARARRSTTYHSYDCVDSARRLRPEVSVRRRARLDRRRRSRRSAPTTRRGCARASPAAGSTSTRTRASAAARTRRRCTARTRTCC